MWEWYKKFKDDWIDVPVVRGTNESVAADDLLQQGYEWVLVNHRLTVSGLSEISRSSLYSTVTEHLGYNNFFASLFSKLLTDNHKKRLQFHLFKNDITTKDWVF